ncbi:MAG: hypothetical protein R3F20_08885 [Planctomycetota bacterium]
MILETVRERAREACRELFGQSPEDISVEFTDKFGDLAVNCFYMAKTLRQAPPKIAAALAEKMVGGPVAAAEAVSGYVNLTLAGGDLFSAAIAPALEAPGSVGDAPRAEAAPRPGGFSSPTRTSPAPRSRPQQLPRRGIARILAAAGREVVQVNLVNDRGIHICKSMLAYQEEGEGRTPESPEEA